MSNSILIEKGTVIDGKGSKLKPSTAVLIEENIISAVGKRAETKAASIRNIKKIDASKCTVMPGLIDAHCHVTFDDPLSTTELFFHRRPALSALIAGRSVQKLLAAGVTSFFDADSIYDVGIDLRDALEAGVVEGPRMATGGNVLITSVGGTAGYLLPDEGRRGYASIVRTPDEIVTEVRRQIKNGVDWIKVHVTGLIPRQKQKGEIQAWTYKELKLVCDTAHDLGIPVVGHCRNASSTRDAANAGFDMILHATYMDDDAVEAIVKHKVPIVPTLTFQANLADWGDQVGADPFLRELFREEIVGSSDAYKKAYKAGVPFLCGTESGFSVVPLGDWHYRELEIFVKYLGMTPMQAITCATSAGAVAMGKEGQIGVIAKGKLADVIIVEGDPSKDVRILGEKKRIKHVFLNGRAIDLKPNLPERKNIPGWRVGQFSNKNVTYEMIYGKK